MRHLKSFKIFESEDQNQIKYKNAIEKFRSENEGKFSSYLDMLRAFMGQTTDSEFKKMAEKEFHYEQENQYLS